jgi:nucleotide-binding universal stress UspA family protein
VKKFGITPVLDVLQRLFLHKDKDAETATPRLPVKQYNTLLLPILSEHNADRLVEIASRFPQVHKVVLCYLINVPRAMTLEGALPEEEEAAGIVLARMVSVLREKGFEVQTQVRRARTPLEETLKVIQEVGADLVLVSRGADADAVVASDSIEKGQLFADTLSEKAPCEVLLLHHA